MATWHQKKARSRDGIKLYDKIKWNVVTDPPGEQCSIMQFSTEADAQAYLYRLKGVGKDRHSTVIPPANR